MSLPSDNKDDIIEEIIVDDDIEEITVEKPKKKRRSSKKKKTKFCKTCGQDILENEKRDMLMFNNTYHQLNAKEYCEDHEVVYSDHKCKPHWCGDCRYLTKYEIEIEIQTGK